MALGTLDVVRQAYGEEAYQWSVPYEVAPSAHFTLGGIVVDSQGSTGVEGLFAAGEVTGGFHGADRLGSMALTECFVVGSTAGYHAWEKSRRKKKAHKLRGCLGLIREVYALFGRPGQETPEKLAWELGDFMWRRAGGVRTRQDLEKARTGIADLVRKSEKVRTPALKKWNLPVQAAIELQSMLVVAEAMVLASQAREESRGTHYRLDYPELSRSWEGKNIVIERGTDGALAALVEIRTTHDKGEDTRTDPIDGAGHWQEYIVPLDTGEKHSVLGLLHYIYRNIDDTLGYSYACRFQGVACVEW